MKTKVRTHNEYFRPVFMGGRKSCPCCHAKLETGESIWSWGEYVRAKWRTVGNFCKACWPDVQRRLATHTEKCGCKVTLVAYRGTPLPMWLNMGVTGPACNAGLVVPESLMGSKPK